MVSEHEQSNPETETEIHIPEIETHIPETQLQMASNGERKPPSPFTLNVNDNPGTIITHVVLEGTNYEEWVRVCEPLCVRKEAWIY